MRRIATAFALAVLLPLAACSDGPDNTGPEGSAAGIYNLQTIDGSPLPFSISTGATDSLTLVEGSIRIRADGTFADHALLRIKEGGKTRDEDDEVTGLWAQDGSMLVLTADQGGTYSVEIRQDLMLQTIGPYSFVYRRER